MDKPIAMILARAGIVRSALTWLKATSPARIEIEGLVTIADKMAEASGGAAAAKKAVDEAEHKLNIYFQSRGRWLYVGGTIVGTALFFLFICGLLKIWVKLIMPGFTNDQRNNILILVFWSSLGTVASVILGLRKLDLAGERQTVMIFLEGALRPALAFSLGFVVTVMLSSGALIVKIGDVAMSGDAGSYVAVFLCGFSEKFFGGVLGISNLSSKGSPEDKKLPK